MKILLFIFVYLLIGNGLKGQALLTNDTEIEITLDWSQEPDGWTYPIAIDVPQGANLEDKYPVCIALHGNGGNGNGMLNNISNLLDCHIVVAPSGYNNSWNICGEQSDAPDVEMIRQLVDKLKTFDNVWSDQIKILGSSNGSALTNQVFIENDSDIHSFVGIVSQLTEPQYQNGGFYGPSASTDPGSENCGYDTEYEIITGRRYLSVCNTNDPVIPYEGGTSVGTSFHPAPEAAYAVAQSQGYMGDILAGEGNQIGNTTVYEYPYLSGQVVLLKGEANHGMDPTQREYIKSFLQDCELITSNSSISKEAAVQVYPNPFYHELSIVREDVAELAYQIYSTQGVLLDQGEIQSSKQLIDLSDLQAGVYLFRIGDWVRKVIKVER